jgi:hypothetical protein
MAATRPAHDWERMIARFDELGRAADATLDACPDAETTDVESLGQLLAERDAVLDELTRVLAQSDVDDGAAEALASAGTSTAALIAKVAERTEALRRALRDLDRGTRATQAYQAPAAGGLVDARR